MKVEKMVVLAAAAAALVLLAGCGPALIRVEEPARSDTPVIELGGAQALDAEFRFGVGELRISGGATKAMEARFDYRPDAWKPEVRYSVEGTTGMLRVEQPDTYVSFLSNARNTWDVRLKEDVPLALRVRRGVGKSTLDLADVRLRRLDVIGGTGDSVIDLGRTARNDVTVDIQAGVGRIVLRVPREAGVRVFGYQDGVGGFYAPGFTPRDANAVYNEAYDKPGVKRYDVRIVRGVGEVRIEQL